MKLTLLLLLGSFCALGAIPSKCPPLPKVPYEEAYQKGCETITFKMVGSASNRDIYYGHYRPTPPENEDERTDAEAMVIYEGPKGVKPDWAKLNKVWLGGGGDGMRLSDPEIVSSKFGPMIVGHIASGNAGFYDDFFLRINKSWKKLDWDSWKKEVKLPKGYHLQAHLIDFDNYTYESSVATPDDCHACSSGGKVSAKLTLKGTKVVLVSYQYSPPEKEPAKN